MEIKLNKEEGVSLNYLECPKCHKSFDSKKRKKTSHHVIPKFLQPKTDIKINLCEECHNELTNCYRGQEIVGQTQGLRYKSENFIQFKEIYNKLRGSYYDKKINRGQFGEGLWSNLMSYLESQDKIKSQKESKK